MMNSAMKTFALQRAIGAAALCALWMTAGDVRAEANKAEYELAERCDKAAADWFRRNWGKTASGEEGRSRITTAAVPKSATSF